MFMVYITSTIKHQPSLHGHHWHLIHWTASCRSKHSTPTSLHLILVKSHRYDRILLQASPYVMFLFVVPVHYFTHVFLLFFSGVWATNIHDATVGYIIRSYGTPFMTDLKHVSPALISMQWADTEPFLGAKYHTVHHTHYHCNFGQVRLFLTLNFPQ